jgi:hypothetical protein
VDHGDYAYFKIKVDDVDAAAAATALPDADAAAPCLSVCLSV